MPLFRDRGPEWLVGSLVVGFVLVLGYAIKSEADWQAWADEHCTVIGKTSSSTGVGPAMTGAGSGVSVVVIPGKTGYRCDDGMEYWR